MAGSLGLLIRLVLLVANSLAGDVFSGLDEADTSLLDFVLDLKKSRSRSATSAEYSLLTTLFLSDGGELQ